MGFHHWDFPMSILQMSIWLGPAHFPQYLKGKLHQQITSQVKSVLILGVVWVHTVCTSRR
jgi:hypothetical protein